jgi:hypothetical protein
LGGQRGMRSNDRWLLILLSRQIPTPSLRQVQLHNPEDEAADGKVGVVGSGTEQKAHDEGDSCHLLAMVQRDEPEGSVDAG